MRNGASGAPRGWTLSGLNFPAVWRAAATYMDKILRGARPAVLPVEQPTTFDFIVNLKAAHALGLAVRRSSSRLPTSSSRRCCFRKQGELNRGGSLSSTRRVLR